MFKYYILPAILFADGYNLDKKHLKKHSLAIFMFGFIGSTIQFVINFKVTDLLCDVFDIKISPTGEYTLSTVAILILTSSLLTTKSITALNILHHDHSAVFGLLFGEGIFLCNI